MRRSRILAIAATAASFGWVLAGGCSAASDDGNVLSGGNFGGREGDAQGDTTVVTPDAEGIGGGSGSVLNPLCGVGQCVPNDPLACRAYVPEPNAGGAGGAGGVNGMAGDGGAAGETPTLGGRDGAAGSGGATGDSSGGHAGEGGADGSAGGIGGASTPSGAGASGDGGASGAPAVDPLTYGCQVTVQDDEQPVRSCGLAGLGRVNAPCFSAADCVPSLACISEGEAGRCLEYCCEGADTCSSGTYCANRPLRWSSATQAQAPSVPVCVPADDCSLEDAYPCPAGADCRCKGNTACMVVSGDGTTTCLTPGAGLQGDACPCAWNHVCSSATQKCLKICRTDPAKNDCGTQKCQASSELPANFGVCVGPIK